MIDGQHIYSTAKRQKRFDGTGSRTCDLRRGTSLWFEEFQTDVRPMAEPHQPQKKPAHPPLRRVLAQNPHVPSDPTSDSKNAHSPLFTSRSNPAVATTLKPQLHHHPSYRQPASITQSDASNPDSCYSSCSEESHASLSREPSDSSQDLNLCSSASASSSSLVGSGSSTLISSSCSGAEDEGLLDFATKLGFSEGNLRIVLEKLGPNAGQDRVLTELIKLGKASSNDARSRSSPKSSSEPATPRLRSIVIDGSNIAMTHGRKEIFSCRGIKECVNFFAERGHTDILVFVPHFRREAPRADCPITDQHILLELESDQRLVWTPSRRVGGRRIVCHDDRYILKTAEEKDAVIVSNDEYRDLIKENPQYRTLVEQRLLMYSFVDGKFMPPDDPLGRRGPTLEQFLGCVPTAVNAQVCPYGKKCTYGNKCKYYHPDRPNGYRMSVTDRLLKEKNNKKLSLAARPSMIYENQMSSNSGRPSPLQNCKAVLGAGQHNSVGRTQSLNLPLGTSPPNNGPSMLANNDITPKAEIMPSFPQQPTFGTHSGMSPPRNDPFSMASMWNSLHIAQHAALNRNVSAPLRNPESPNSNLQPNLMSPGGDPFSRSNSLSDMLFMQQHGQFTTPPPPIPSRVFQGGHPALKSCNSETSHMFAPSTAIWGESEYSVGPMFRTRQEMRSNLPDSNDRRLKLQYHLCQLFPEATVIAVMSAHPDETNPQKLCQRIIAFQQGFDS